LNFIWIKFFPGKGGSFCLPVCLIPVFYYLIYTWIVLYLCCQYIDKCYGCFFWLPGVLEKVGVEPQVQRIGKYKSAGDQLSRKEMSEANREMLTALLDDIYANFLQKISSSTGYWKP
jgi:hypothetical protein